MNEIAVVARRLRPGVVLSCGSAPDRTVVEVQHVDDRIVVRSVDEDGADHEQRFDPDNGVTIRV